MTSALTIRPYELDDFTQLLRIQQECFPLPFPPELLWKKEQIASHVFRFPEGALCAVLGDEVVGSATCNRIDVDRAHLVGHTWAEAADNGYLRNFDPGGNTLYGIDVAVRPGFRGQGVARALYAARFAVVRRFGMQRFLAGSRLSGYHHHAEMLTPEAYAEAVINGALTDPVITPQLKAGLRPIVVVRDYVPDDDARNCALMMEWTP